VTLASVLADLPQVAPGRAAALSRLGVRTVSDLVRWFPTRYEQIEAESTVAEIAPDQIATARGELTATRFVRAGKMPRFEAVLHDGTARLDLVWFNGAYLQGRLYPGVRVRVSGKTKRFKTGVQMANPTLEVLSDDRGEPESRGARIRPVYSASEQISSREIEGVVARVLPRALPLLEDHLPGPYREERALVELREAYRLIHGPETMAQATEARRRLAYDELLLLQLAVFLRRAELKRTLRSPALRWTAEIDARIRARFPFALTAGQDAAVRDLVADLTSPDPSNRLVQGDVGSGKTVVALYAMLLAAASEHQAALMAPTELLAEQHFASISRVLAGSGVRIELLTGAMPAADKEAVQRRVAAGTIDLLVGTHALLTESVRFSNLGVVVIDEQHRFGVHQRAGLRSKAGEEGVTPHIVVMTATPIPRTLALTLFGDLDVSTIRELPPGRTPIATRVVTPDASGEVYTYLRRRVEAGEQGYVVVPAIDSGASTAGGDPELNDLRTVQARLERDELEGRRVAVLHGRLSRETRETIMARFRAGKIDVLVATTVIEVGVDVPSATVMVIEHAERFGLAQLHQLRGRVGRGSKKSVCVLLADPTTDDAKARMGAIAGSTDGFALAEKDLEIRGPGEVFGLRQAGAPPLLIADFMRDRDLLVMARRDASAWIARSPNLGWPDDALVRRRVLKAHGKWLGIGDVG
jgi:ATP-dependent DNA helicase RecG